MGNAIKNFEKKQRQERKKLQREMQAEIYNTIMQQLPCPKELKDRANCIHHFML